MSDPHPYTHGYGAAVLGSHRARTAQNSAAHLLPHLRPGQRLLDVGSGAGTITADLARIVGPADVVALEVGEEPAALTRAELARQGLEEVRVLVGDAQAMPLGDASFDVVHAHQVLQHLPDPVRAFAEMRRVTRPGGLVAVRDSDYEGFRWWPEVPGLDRWLELYLRATRANSGTPDAGRRLLAWAREAGFRDVTSSSSTWLHATPESRAAGGELVRPDHLGTARGPARARGMGRRDRASADRRGVPHLGAGSRRLVQPTARRDPRPRLTGGAPAARRRRCGPGRSAPPQPGRLTPRSVRSRPARSPLRAGAAADPAP